MKLSAALLALSLTAPIGLISSAATPTSAQTATTELSPAQATKVSELLLEALRQRQASVLHQTLTDSVRSSITVEQVQKRLDRRVAINSSRVVEVSPGYRTTTVDAVVTTVAGEQPLLIVLDDEGKLLAWKWTDQVQAIETTALAFVKDLADGQWLNARSRMSLELQQDLAPADLQRKWTKLATVSGGFRSIKDAVIASQGGDQQPLLVAVEFGNTTSNLFVIFDSR